MRALRPAFAGVAVLMLMFSTTALAVAQAHATESAAPAAMTESSSPVATEASASGVAVFPVGHFVSVENGRRMLEFHGDGTGMSHEAALDAAVPFTYAVEDDVYTAVKGGSAVPRLESEQVAAATYRWDYDGERLAFELLGEDPDTRRKSLMSEYTFRLIEEPRVVMVAISDLDVGDPVQSWEVFVAAAEAEPDAYTRKAGYLGHVAAAPIAKGQPITPDLVEPTE